VAIHPLLRNLIVRASALLALAGTLAVVWWLRPAPARGPRPVAGAPALELGRTAVATRSPARAAGGGAFDDDDDDNPDSKRPRFGETVVYLDGDPIAVMRYGEMPKDLPVHLVRLEDGSRTRRFQLSEYLTSVGVDVATLRELHLYGGRERIAIIKGPEFRRVARRILFSYTRETTGKPRFHYPGNDVAITDSIDLIAAVALYVKKTPPRWNAQEFYLEDEHGTEIEGIPYAKQEMRGGMRVYLDGRLAASVKRNLLSSDVAVPGSEDDAEPRYSLAACLKPFGVDILRVRTMDFVADDRTILSLRSRDVRGPIEFRPLQDSHGKVTLLVPREKQLEQITVNSVALYTSVRRTIRR
jgi:hypothetical protein